MGCDFGKNTKDSLICTIDKKDCIYYLPSVGKCYEERHTFYQQYIKLQNQQMQWISVKDKLPNNRKPVLAVVKEDAFIYVVRASYAKKFDIESTTDYDEEFFDYDEKTDAYYCKPGWYETNVFEETHWGVCGEVTHWMPLPEPPQEDG